MKYLLSGFATGVALGLLFAPAKGAETRSRLVNKLRDLRDLPKRMLDQKITEAAQQAEKKAGDIGSKVGREAARAAVRSVEQDVLDQRTDKPA